MSPRAGPARDDRPGVDAGKPGPGRGSPGGAGEDGEASAAELAEWLRLARTLDHDAPTASPAADGGGRRPPVRIVLLALATLTGGWISVAAVEASAAWDHFRDGLRIVRDSRPADPAGVDEPEVRRGLERAGEAFAAGRAKLASPVLAPARIVPGLRGQLAAVDDVASAAASTTEVAIDLLDDLRREMPGLREPGPARLASLGRLQEAVEHAAGVLEQAGPGDRAGLLPPVRDAVRRAAAVRQAANDRARMAAAGLEATRAVLGANSRYLVLASNNAEMRAGSGMFLQVGVLELDGGHLRLGPLTPTSEHYRPQSSSVLDPDMAARWGWLHPNREWRNLNLTPRFDVAARLAAAMWAEAGHPPVDGVVAVDVEALTVLLEATGPVEVGARRVGGPDARTLLMVQQYGLFDGEPADALASRRELLGDLTAEVLGALSAGRFDPYRLGTGLVGAARGRHVLLWSPRAEVQEGWRAAGLAGEVSPSSVLVALLNRGGSKLDPYLDVRASLRLQPGSSSTTVTIGLQIANHAPADLPSYVTGVVPLLGVTPGDHLGMLSVTLPGAARNPSISGPEPYGVAGPDGPTLVVAKDLLIPRGTTRSVEVRFELPGPTGELTVEPSARIPAVTWRQGGDWWRDDRARTVAW